MAVATYFKGEHLKKARCPRTFQFVNVFPRYIKLAMIAALQSLADSTLAHRFCMLADVCQRKKELKQLWLFIIDSMESDSRSMQVSECHPVACHCLMREPSVQHCQLP